MTIALVIGGAEGVHEEWARALEMCRPDAQLVCNSMIGEAPVHCVGVTLHPWMMLQWTQRRAALRLPPLEVVWTFRPARSACEQGVTRVLPKWGRPYGSVSLYAVQAALETYQATHVVLCGCPMQAHRGHFLTGRRWIPADAFRRGWVHRREMLGAVVRSMSGWTAETFGEPTAEWLGKG